MTQPGLFTEPPLPTELLREGKRRLTNKAKVLARLKLGPATARQLSEIALKYTNRISELRQDGYVIACDDQGHGRTMYRLMGYVPRENER